MFRVEFYFHLNQTPFYMKDFETRFETKTQSNSQTGLLARINLFPVVDSLQVVSSWNDRMNGGAWAVGSSLGPEDDRCNP